MNSLFQPVFDGSLHIVKYKELWYVGKWAGDYTGWITASDQYLGSEQVQQNPGFDVCVPLDTIIPILESKFNVDSPNKDFAPECDAVRVVIQEHQLNNAIAEIKRLQALLKDVGIDYKSKGAL